MNEVKMLVILSTQRSGSTMVCDDIAGAEVLGRPSEYFIKVIESIGKVGADEMKKLIEDAVCKGETANGVAAVKIMSNQIKSIGKAIHDAGLCDGADVERCFFEYFKDAVFVRVIRTDKVAQAVSRIMAKKTDVYHAADSIAGMENMLGKVAKKRDESSLEYDYDEIEEEVDLIRKEEQYLNAFIKRQGVNVERIIYEEAVVNRDYVLEIGKNMEIQDITLKERRLKKVSGSMSKVWIRDFKAQRLEKARLAENQ